MVNDIATLQTYQAEYGRMPCKGLWFNGTR